MNTDSFPKLDPVVNSLVVKDKLQSIYVVFRKGQIAKETVRFGDDEGSQGDRMLIDRGFDDYPVACQFISANGIPISELSSAPKPHPNEVHEAFSMMFAYATEMLRFHDFRRQRRGNQVINTVKEQIKRVPVRELNLEKADLVCA